MADEFERSLLDMGLIEPEVSAEDVRNDLVIEALLGSRLVPDSEPPLEPPQEAPLEPPLEAPLEPPPGPLIFVAPSAPSAPPEPASEPAIDGELHDVISLLAEGRNPFAALNVDESVLRTRLRRGFAARIERKRFGPEPAETDAIKPRAKKPKLASAFRENCP